jgi:hypothetical protein
MSSWRRCARAFFPATLIIMGSAFAAMAQSAGGDDPRPLIDSAATGQTPPSIDHKRPLPPKRAGAAERTRKEAPRQGSTSNSIAPSYFSNSLPTRGTDRDISAVLKKSGAGDPDLPGTRPDPRLGLGTFSLGVETDANYKVRSPLNPDASDTGYDATYDPRRRVSVPFIGFSAKSILP